VAVKAIEAELDGGYGVFSGGKVQWATLKFTPEAARWVSAQNWHPKQRSRVEKDGSYVLEVPYAEDRELVMEILKYGAEVQVLEPAALRARVAEALRAAARLYEPAP
jgi:predicted DNA-binding transcriptional regulator YafY